jgi:membrane-associated phospholipid phosphatase
MFQTEIIIFIQSGSNEFWTGFFRFWTEIGFSHGIAPFVLVILFGVRFRAGVVLLHAVLWTGLITHFFKQLFALPRPCNVDHRVLMLGRTTVASSPFSGMGAGTFFGELPESAVRLFRDRPWDSWGFPSGHTSGAVALWGSAALMFRNKILWLWAASAMILIPFSRLYLGRHFLADVLAGYGIGAAAVILFHYGMFRRRWFLDLVDGITRKGKTIGCSPFLYFYLVGLPIVLTGVPGINREGLAALLGINLGFLAVRRKRLPEDSAGLSRRAARVGIALLFYFGWGALLKGAARLAFDAEPPGVMFLRVSLLAFLVMWGSTAASLRLGWFKRRPPAAHGF